MLCSTVVIFTIERKGDIKGGKGKSAKASRASVVPQTNCKQCVWKSGSYSGTDNGKIKVYVNGIRIMNNTLQRKFIPFQIIIIIKTKTKTKKTKKNSRRTFPLSSMEFFQTNTILPTHSIDNY